MRIGGQHQGGGAEIRLEQGRLAHRPGALGPAQPLQEGASNSASVELERALQPLADRHDRGAAQQDGRQRALFRRSGAASSIANTNPYSSAKQQEPPS